MDYAVIKTTGHQFIVSKGSFIDLPNLNVAPADKIVFDQVLLTNINNKVTLGMPLVSGSVVEGKIVKNFLGEKIDVLKFKAKSRYRRKIGFREKLTKVEIVSLS